MSPTFWLFSRAISSNSRAGLALGQRGGRLVEDEQAHPAEQRLGDLRHLLVRAREVVDALRSDRGRSRVRRSAPARACASRAPATRRRSRSSRPRNRFSSTVRLGTSENSWNTGLMPIARARCGVRWRISSPPNRNVPSSGGNVPEITLIRVDLPAPFSPNRTCSSPARTSRSTRSSARTPVKPL